MWKLRKILAVVIAESSEELKAYLKTHAISANNTVFVVLYKFCVTFQLFKN